MKRESMKLGRALTIVAVIAVIAVVVTGCQSESSGSRAPETSSRSEEDRVERSSTTSTTAAPASAPGQSGPLEELRSKLRANGLCDELSTFTPLLPVTVTGLANCEDGYLLITLPSQVERDIVILYIIDYPCTDTTNIAESDTWIVFPVPATATRAGNVADILGGDVRAIPCERA